MDKKKFNSDGYAIFDISQIIDQLSDLRREAFAVFDLFSTQSGGAGVSDDSDLVNFSTANQPLQFQALKHLWFSPKLFAIAGNDFFVEQLKTLGFVKPSLELPPLLRCDMPVKKQSIFEQHQDYSYNIGSENSVTIWIPLQDTNEEMGALLVAPSSHLNGVYPNNKGIISEDYKFNFISTPVAFGEALIFNQKTVHQSGFNISNKVRFSIQLRFTDLGCKHYKESGYPLNHKITTEKFLGDLSK